jgi:hypothetical protein
MLFIQSCMELLLAGRIEDTNALLLKNLKNVDKTMNFDKLASRALIGAIIGGSVVCLMVVLFAEARFFLKTLAVLGSGGVIGGALCGLVLGRANNWVGVIMGGLIGGIGGCALITVGIFFYTAIPWPSPQPYPGVETHMELGGGSWGPSRVQTYTTTLSFETIEQYYTGQMNQYCTGEWQFENIAKSQDQRCGQAACSIPRFGLEQYFTVRLCTLSETETLITHIDSWQD